MLLVPWHVPWPTEGLACNSCDGGVEWHNLTVRPLKTAPCYDRLQAMGAVFGQKYGWERANWFAPEGVLQEDHWSFRRSNYFEHIGNEVRNVAKNAGLLDR